MAVRRLLHGDIEPVAALAVGEGQHYALGEQVILVGGYTLKRTVHKRHHLGAGDGRIGTERAVGIALDPAHLRSNGDGLIRPVFGGHIGELHTLDGLGVRELREHRGELGAGNGLVGTERAALGGVNDHAGLFESCDAVVVPRTGLDVGEAALGREILIARLVREQTEENGRDLGAGDAAVRAHRAVGIAHDVGVVIARVQRGLARGGGMIGAGVVEDDIICAGVDGDGFHAVAIDAVTSDTDRFFLHDGVEGLTVDPLVIRDRLRRILEIVVDGIAQVSALGVVNVDDILRLIGANGQFILIGAVVVVAIDSDNFISTVDLSTEGHTGLNLFLVQNNVRIFLKVVDGIAQVSANCPLSNEFEILFQRDLITGMIDVTVVVLPTGEGVAVTLGSVGDGVAAEVITSRGGRALSRTIVIVIGHGVDIDLTVKVPGKFVFDLRITGSAFADLTGGGGETSNVGERDVILRAVALARDLGSLIFRDVESRKIKPRGAIGRLLRGAVPVDAEGDKVFLVFLVISVFVPLDRLAVYGHISRELGVIVREECVHVDGIRGSCITYNIKGNRSTVLHEPCIILVFQRNSRGGILGRVDCTGICVELIYVLLRLDGDRVGVAVLGVAFNTIRGVGVLNQRVGLALVAVGGFRIGAVDGDIADQRFEVVIVGSVGSLGRLGRPLRDINTKIMIAVKTPMPLVIPLRDRYLIGFVPSNGNGYFVAAADSFISRKINACNIVCGNLANIIFCPPIVWKRSAGTHPIFRLRIFWADNTNLMRQSIKSFEVFLGGFIQINSNPAIFSRPYVVLRQRVERQQGQCHHKHQNPRQQPLSCFLSSHKKIPPSFGRNTAHRRGNMNASATGCHAVRGHRLGSWLCDTGFRRLCLLSAHLLVSVSRTAYD